MAGTLRNHSERFPLQNQDNVDSLEVNASLKIFKCSICEKAFLSETNFMSHIRMHKWNKDSNVRIFTIEEPETCSNEGTGLRQNQGNGHSEKKQNSHWNNNKSVRTKSLSSTGTQPSSVKEEEIVVIADGDIDDVVIRHDEIKAGANDTTIPGKNKALKHESQKNEPKEHHGKTPRLIEKNNVTTEYSSGSSRKSENAKEEKGGAWKQHDNVHILDADRQTKFNEQDKTRQNHSIRHPNPTLIYWT